ncbi:MAG: fasciclin domain-containing protein [Gemmatimonadaceae bacterium]|nr:fasciclin domain-containing protein [Chitinophagaceae bacterium]
MSNITQVVNTDKSFKTLKKGIHAADLDQLLSSSGPYTFFGPTDAAFSKFENGRIEQLLDLKNKEQLTDLMNNHIVKGRYAYQDFRDGDVLNSVNGRELLVKVTNGNVKISDVPILSRDSKISNGIVYQMETVLE